MADSHVRTEAPYRPGSTNAYWPWLEPTADPAQVLAEVGFGLAREHEIESMFTVANGVTGTRGALAEDSAMSSPTTFIAGMFCRPDGGSVSTLLRGPNWIAIRAVVEGQELRHETGTVLSHCRLLDMPRGVLRRTWRHEDPTGRITVLESIRLASLADRRLLFQALAITPENYSGLVVVEADLDGDRVGEDGRYLVSTRVSGDRMLVAFAAHTRVLMEGTELGRQVTIREDRAIERWGFQAHLGRTYVLERLVAVATSRMSCVPDAEARRTLGTVLQGGVDVAISAHAETWRQRWDAAHLEVEGDAIAQRALNLARYHLISSANPEDDGVAIGARGLTGPAYKGHVFWDTDIYLLPFYVFTFPEAARSHLMYRYGTLSAARQKAMDLGYRGALFAWESTDSGREETPPFGLGPDGQVVPIASGRAEHHISADVAYAVYQYWNATGDDALMVGAGAEILFETARFWVSRSALASDGQLHIRSVVGPDEYHEDVDDDAYTNHLAAWNLESAVQIARWLVSYHPARWQDLRADIGLSEHEVYLWGKAAEHLFGGRVQADGIVEQFAGYFDRPEIPASEYLGHGASPDVLLGRDRVRNSQIIKQADVLMLLALLPDTFSESESKANFSYYEARTAHGSSLSPGIHALVAARLGDLDRAARYFQQTAEIDLSDNMGNAAGGVHLGALGSLWQAAVLGFGGLHARPDGLLLEPRLPPGWSGLRFRIRWRGSTLLVCIRAETRRVEIRHEGGDPVNLVSRDGASHTLATGRCLTMRLEPSGWGPWEDAR